MNTAGQYVSGQRELCAPPPTSNGQFANCPVVVGTVVDIVVVSTVVDGVASRVVVEIGGLLVVFAVVVVFIVLVCDVVTSVVVDIGGLLVCVVVIVVVIVGFVVVDLLVVENGGLLVCVVVSSTVVVEGVDVAVLAPVVPSHDTKFGSSFQAPLFPHLYIVSETSPLQTNSHSVPV